MTEERIQELFRQAQEENKKAGYEFLDEWDIYQFARTVATEARKEGREGGIEEMRDEIGRKLTSAWLYEIAERLEEQG